MSEGANVLHFCHRLVGADGDRQKRLDDSSPRGRVPRSDGGGTTKSMALDLRRPARVMQTSTAMAAAAASAVTTARFLRQQLVERPAGRARRSSDSNEIV